MVVFERSSSVDPALSAYSTRAREVVAALTERLPQNWQAHHEIPFNVVAKQPIAFQEALVDAGWIMDSAENLAALPADRESYGAPPNNFALPMHNGSHPNYDAMVRDMLAPIVDSYENMSPEELRAAMNEVGERAMARINQSMDKNALELFHDRLN